MRFTPQTQTYLSVRESDKGRPIGELSHQLDYYPLEADARQVLETLQPVDREVRSNIEDKGESQSREAGGDAGEEWFLVRLRPYRTVEDKIDGVVAAFVDITDLKQPFFESEPFEDF